MRTETIEEPPCASKGREQPSKVITVGVLERKADFAPASGLGLFIRERHELLQQLQTVDWVQCRYASVMSYRLAQIFLRQAYRGGWKLPNSSVKVNVRSVGQRLEQETQW
ncbi:hypothetical protein [Cupriavidus sp. 8B]